MRSDHWDHYYHERRRETPEERAEHDRFEAEKRQRERILRFAPEMFAVMKSLLEGEDGARQTAEALMMKIEQPAPTWSSSGE